MQRASNCRDISYSYSRELSSSQPDYVGADYYNVILRTNYLTRQLRRSMSLSFRNLYIEGEQSILLDDDQESESQQKSLSSTDLSSFLMTEKQKGDTEEEEETSEPPDLCSKSCSTVKTENQEFFTREMNEYVMIGEECRSLFPKHSDSKGRGAETMGDLSDCSHHESFCDDFEQNDYDDLQVQPVRSIRRKRGMPINSCLYKVTIIVRY